MTALAIGLLVAGAAFSFLAAVGILRMPDVYMRMQASSKAGTLGCTLILAAVGLAYGEVSVVTRAVLVMAFVMLTAPVAAHVVSRAAYRTGTPPAPETSPDDLRSAPSPNRGERPARESRREG